MATLAKVLKDEIQRLARKEAKAVIQQTQEQNKKLRQTVSQLRKRVDAIERERKRTVKQLERVQQVTGQPEPPSTEDVARARITARNVRSLRKRLKLSQADFARLLGVTPAAVSQMENREGTLRLRHTTRAAIVQLRETGTRQAKEQLKQLEGETATGDSPVTDSDESTPKKKRKPGRPKGSKNRKKSASAAS
jgi:transcriptional regulator with XRE-family HTH domain